MNKNDKWPIEAKKYDEMINEMEHLPFHKVGMGELHHCFYKMIYEYSKININVLILNRSKIVEILNKRFHSYYNKWLKNGSHASRITPLRRQITKMYRIVLNRHYDIVRSGGRGKHPALLPYENVIGESFLQKPLTDYEKHLIAKSPCRVRGVWVKQ